MIGRRGRSISGGRRSIGDEWEERKGEDISGGEGGEYAWEKMVLRTQKG